MFKHPYKAELKLTGINQVDQSNDLKHKEDSCPKHFDRSDWVPDFTKGNFDASTMSKHQQKLFVKLRQMQYQRKNYGWFTADLN
jgi:hypothetical protein